MSTQSIFQLKGTVFTLTVLQLLENDLEKLSTQLKSLLEKNPIFFQQAPLVVDIQKIAPREKIDFVTLNKLLREEGFIPVAIRGGSEAQQKKAVLANWAILSRVTKEKEEVSGESVKSLPEASISEPFAKIITQPVRSGQQIYAQNQDLIVLASVSPGAELISDGHIHVYGTLRGRALAGVKGNKEARIFCQSLEAELVAVAGHYWLNEVGKQPDSKKGVQVYLQADHLQIAQL
jgi:septum site-determining protein MinC